jgi:acetylornithine deacetylase/succinyl-diaminopimelate desuccinylase family protein
MNSCIGLLKELVAIPSINPMGKAPASGNYGENDIAYFVADTMKGSGIDVELYDVSPNRPNVVGFIDGHADRTLMLEAHLDTVFADGMTIDPFMPTIANGKLYGRGSCDTKGSLAAFLHAVCSLANEGKKPTYNIILAAVADEEFGFTGAEALLARGLKADGAIVGEPTELHIVRAHKGVLRWKLRTTGIAAHSAYPFRGRSAVYAMARVIMRLEEYAGMLEGQKPHPLLGTPTMNVGTIVGGEVVNAVPDKCVIEIDRRMLPGETDADVLRLVREALAGLGDWEFEPPYLSVAGMEVGEQAEIVSILSQAVKHYCGDVIVESAHYATDAGHYNRAGIPSIVFGPGNIAQAHTAGEYIELAQLEQAAMIVTRMLTI